MRLNRDTFILFITFGPAAVVLWAFLHWRATGQWPGAIPQVSIPDMQTPAWLQQAVHLPSWAQPYINRARQNWVIMLTGLGAGLILGIMSIGTLADLVRTAATPLASWLHSGDDDESDDDTGDTGTLEPNLHPS